ncbi:MAG: translocated intimin receptor Tir [Edaphobacter sp.]|nr:translocated intimin receptor Tir [Edaphobacter sp.]MDE1175769.1 translocated intimin receptor Tir [Edaphobacter sp.]
MKFAQMTKAIVTDSHFLVPFFVLLAGIVLLVVLH